MRFIALALLGGAVLMTVGCSSSRSLSRQDVMADHIASVRPDGTTWSTPAPVQTTPVQATTPTHARRAAPSVVTYASTTPRTTARYVPAPPPPPAMPRAAMPTTTRFETVSRPAPSARVAQPVRTAPVARTAPKTRTVTRTRRAPAAASVCPPKKRSGWKLFGGCPGGT